MVSTGMKIERSALVAHTAMDMYRLVEDVSSYPDFLSWCTRATVHEQNGDTQRASLAISVAGIQQQFTTLNELDRGSSVIMKLLDGPFNTLRGEWYFKQLGEDGSKVQLKLEFELSSGLEAALFGKGFGRIADQLVDEFCKQADKVYT